MSEIFEEETVLTYFANTGEQDYETYEEAEAVVLGQIAEVKEDFSKLVKAKLVKVNEDGSYTTLSGTLNHEQLSNLPNSNYLVYSVWAGGGQQVFCNNSQKVKSLIELNLKKRLEAISHVMCETMTVRDQTNDRGFVVPEIVIVEGEDYPHDLGENPLGSDYVQNGIGLNLTTNFEYNKILVNV